MNTEAAADTRHLTASVVLLDLQAKKVLLIHHVASGRWQFPGGHVDPGEDLGQAAVREVYEETGLRVELYHPHRGLELPGVRVLVSPYLACQIPAPAKPDRPGKPAEPAHQHVDLLFVTVSSSAIPLVLATGEVAAGQWFPWDALPDQARADVPMVVELATKRWLAPPA